MSKYKIENPSWHSFNTHNYNPIKNNFETNYQLKSGSKQCCYWSA